MTAQQALYLAAELIRLGANAYRDNQEQEVRIEDIGKHSSSAFDELDAYLKTKEDE